MGRFHYTSHGLGHSDSNFKEDPSPNHFKTASLSPAMQKKIAAMGLERVAGNAYRCKSTQDFWKVDGDKILRLSADEVDNGDHLAAAPADNPGMFLSSILSDLTF